MPVFIIILDILPCFEIHESKWIEDLRLKGLD
jgi:hypothetical protein